MTPVFFVVAILGCGDGAAQCEQARVLPARYETAAQCRAALPRRLAENTDVAFPEILADCREQGARVAETPKGGKHG